LLVFACNTCSNIRKNSQLGRYLASSSFIVYLTRHAQDKYICIHCFIQNYEKKITPT
jgi:hypothetical protein